MDGTPTDTPGDDEQLAAGASLEGNAPGEMTDDQARAVIAAAEEVGFVREPSLPGAYETYLHEDAEEAAEYLAARITVARSAPGAPS